MDEKQMIRLAQQGNAPAAEQLVKVWYQPVFAYFYKNTGQYHLSKDLTQETFLRMISALGSCLKNHWRTLSRRPEELSLTDDHPQEQNLLQQSAQHQDLEVALSRLPPEQREAVVLRYYHDFTIREIGSITDAGESTVKARLRYGLAKLRRELAGYEEE